MRPTSLLFDFTTGDVRSFGQTIRDGWASRGWDIGALDAFRMEDAGGAGGDGGDGGSGSPAGGGDDKLREAGKKALDEERAAAKAAEKRAKEAEAKLAAAEQRAKELEEANASEADKALAKARDEAAEAARADEREKSASATAKANQRLVAAEARVQALVAGVNPERVAAFFDSVSLSDQLNGIEVADDGVFDVEAVKKAITARLEATPEFKSAPGKGGGGFDGGARGGDRGTAGGIEAGRERARKERETAEANRRDPFAGMTVAGRPQQ